MARSYKELHNNKLQNTQEKGSIARKIGTLRYQDGELRRGRHCKSKTGTSPVVAAKNKILKIVYF